MPPAEKRLQEALAAALDPLYVERATEALKEGKVVFATPRGAIFCQRNPAKDHGDGGPLALAVSPEFNKPLSDEAIAGVSATVNYKEDWPLEQRWPLNKTDERRYTVIIIEEPLG